MQTLPLAQDLVLIGGGHTHALILRMWGMRPLPGTRLTVIDPSPTAAYSGMLPGFVAGHYGRDDLDIDLVRLARFAGARLIVEPATGIDLAARRVTVPGRPPVVFDVASLDIGVTSDLPDLPGFADHGVAAKPLGRFADRWSAFRDGDAPPLAVVIGGGVAGAELAMAMAHALKPRGGQVTIVERDRALTGLGDGARALLLREMAALGITLVEGVTVTQLLADRVMLSDGSELPSRLTVGAAGARPQDWLARTGLGLSDGFVTVNAFLQSTDEGVFAAGDCAHMAASPRPKAGVFAVRQAPVLYDNLVARLSGGQLRPYRPQRDYLKLVSLGGRRAMAVKWGRVQGGAAFWRVKDRIDRVFVDKLGNLPPMAPPEVPLTVAQGVAEAMGDVPPCGGCGAKLGRRALQAGLAGLSAPRADVLRPAGEDAAILLTGGVRQVITTDHLRSVTEDPVLMTRIAAVHALGDIWAMGAEPQAALVSLTLPPLSPALQARTMAEIMATAEEVITAAGGAIAGGHSAQGPEMTIGFTLTGLCEGPPITLAGATAGDVLILTKPIGTGVVLAAEMRGLARAGDVIACHATMTRPQTEAARLLATVAHAMTDVTGFGLAGHLAGMADASGLGAELDLAAIPLLPGALDLAERGVRSSLWPENRAAVGPIAGETGGTRAELLFDPQTCGGLLAAVPEHRAAALLARLCATGHQAAIIGRMVEGAGLRLG
ncbi:MAG: selenide, water dikinase SelD [Rubellimicrobium sp.]|nr:selenide, water dikinase SelD [Rubellimicrobium sp.]